MGCKSAANTRVAREGCSLRRRGKSIPATHNVTSLSLALDKIEPSTFAPKKFADLDDHKGETCGDSEEDEDCENLLPLSKLASRSASGDAIFKNIDEKSCPR